MSAVLIISPEPWEAQAVSKHHYARVLAETGRKVLFLDPPTPSRTLSVTEVDDLPGLRVLRGPGVLRGLRMMPSIIRRNLEGRWLRRVELLCEVPISTIWLFENSRFFDMRFAGDRLKIYHQVDLNQDFHPLVAARSADVCLCTTDIIGERLRRVRPDVHKIHHGTALVSNPTRCDEESARAFRRSGKHVVCLGNLSIPYLDIGALVRLRELHRDVTFHFVGEYSRHSQLYMRLAGHDNVVWWGRRSHRDIPEILAAADVLLVPYDARRFRAQLASPHKMMEYLLSGKVVVASFTDEYKDKPNLIEMAGLDDAIDSVFERVIHNLDVYNAPARMAERRSFALDCTYEKQLYRISEIVRESTGRAL